MMNSTNTSFVNKEQYGKKKKVKAPPKKKVKK
jgi:hypothetical protein